MSDTTITLTKRELSLVKFGLCRVMWEARTRAEVAAQDHKRFFSKPGDAAQFIQDAMDIEALLTKLPKD